MAANQVTGSGAVTMSSYTATGIGFSGAQIKLSDNVLVSSEAAIALGAGVRVSTNMYIVGFASATKFYGDGSGLTGISGDNLGNHIATKDLVMSNLNVNGANFITASSASFTNAVTASSFTATGIGVSAAQIKLSDNVLVSSEAAIALGAGVRVSTNIYIVGFASATKFYGDGSGLTGISGDNLGNHTATTNLIMGANQLTGSGAVTMSSATLTGPLGIGAAKLLLNPNVELSSTTAANYGGVYASTHIFVNGDLHAAKIYGDGSGLTSLNVAGDNLGSHIATATLNMASWNLVNVSSVNFLPNVFLTSATNANYGGVYASSHVFINGDIRATKIYGDISGASGLPAAPGDSLGTHVATQTLNMAGFNIAAANHITGSSASFTNAVTASSFTATGIGFSGAQIKLSDNVLVSSESSTNLGAGVRVSTNMYVVGFASATRYYGDGSGLTGISGDNLGNHIATKDLAMSNLDVTGANFITASSASFANAVTASSFTATGIGVSAAQIKLSDNVLVSSEASANLGAGVRVSTNMYIVGFASATKFYGDGSGLSGILGDNLGNHIATKDLAMSNLDVTGANFITASSASFTNAVTASSFTATGIGFSGAQIKLSDNVLVSSESSANLGAGVRVSTNMYLVGFSSAAKYYGDGSSLTGILGDNLGNHIATKDLAMSNLDITGANFITASSASFSNAVTASSFTATGIGVSAAQIRLSDNVLVSSESSTNLGAGVRVSTNMYIVGFASATKFYGDGSGLTGISGDNLGNHTATQNLVMAANQVTGSGAVTMSSYTATGIGVSAAQIKLSDNVLVSSESSTNLGAGVRVSTNMYIVGFASATKFYGDGSGLTGISGDNLGNHIATTDLIMGANQVTGSGAVTMSSYTATGIGFSGAQIKLSDNVLVSSEAAIALGAGVRVSTNMYIVGFASATKFYGDGSGLSGISGDNLGNHIATTNLIMGANQVTGAGAVTMSSYTATGIGFSGAQIKLSDNVLVSSEAAIALGAGVRVSTNMYLVGFSSAAKYYGDGSSLTGILGDNLGNHTATTDLIMGANQVTGAGAVTMSSYTATGIGVSAAQIKLSDNVLVSSESSTTFGAGVRVSTNMYVVGFSSAAKYYGDGSGLTGVPANLSGGEAPRLPYWATASTLGNSNLSRDSDVSLTAVNSTFTVQGNAFSVGGSTLTVTEGKVGIGVAAPGKAFEVKNTGTTFKVDTNAGFGSLFIDGVEMVRLKP